ncbi:unnamed protein product, partial [Ectocarpus sp. 6 AP-2014]
IELASVRQPVGRERRSFVHCQPLGRNQNWDSFNIYFLADYQSIASPQSVRMVLSQHRVHDQASSRCLRCEATQAKRWLRGPYKGFC